MDTTPIHIHEFEEIVVPPTCAEPGYTRYQCRCGYEHKGNFKPVGTHTYVPTEEVPATCTEPGSIRRICTVCGNTVTEALPPLGHDHTPWAVQTYPTCTEPGKQVRECTRCGNREENQIPATGHKPVPGTERFAGDGIKEYFCENCGQTVTFVPQNTVPVASCLPARFLLLLTSVFSFFQLLFMIRFDADPSSGFAMPLLAYSAPLLTLFCTILWFAKAGSIKQSDRFLRWSGALTLTLAVHGLINIIANTMRVLDIFTFLDLLAINLLPFFRILFLIFLTILFFSAAPKKTWQFIVVLSLGITLAFISCISLLTLRAGFNIWYRPYIFTEYISGALFWIALAMLIAPGKKHIATDTPSTPVA